MAQINSTSSMELVIWCMFIGLVLASIFMFYQKKVIGAFVRALLNAQASDSSSAKTLNELGFARNFPVRSALRGGGALRKLVWEMGDNYLENENGVKYSARQTPLDVNTARFYITEENRIRAELRYNDKGTDIFMLIITVLVFLMVAYLAATYLPDLLKLIETNL